MSLIVAKPSCGHFGHLSRAQRPRRATNFNLTKLDLWSSWWKTNRKNIMVNRKKLNRFFAHSGRTKNPFRFKQWRGHFSICYLQIELFFYDKSSSKDFSPVPKMNLLENGNLTVGSLISLWDKGKGNYGARMRRPVAKTISPNFTKNSLFHNSEWL